MLKLMWRMTLSVLLAGTVFSRVLAQSNSLNVAQLTEHWQTFLKGPHCFDQLQTGPYPNVIALTATKESQSFFFLKRLLKISKLTCRVLLLLTIFFLGVLFSDQAKAQVLPNFGPVWNRLMVTSRSFRPATDLDWPGKKDNWWVLTISNDKLTTSNIAGFVTLTFDRAWVELPTTKPKDPLAGNNYSLNIVLDLHYNSISRKTYSFGLGGDEIIGGGNETKPGYFFIALPRSMILSFPLKPTATMNNCVSIITSAIQRDESWPNVGLYSKPIGDEIPFWKVSTTALPDFSGLFQPIK